MKDGALDGFFAAQDGVVSRAQILSVEGDDNDIERLLRRRVLARVFDGVFVNHTGPLSWSQRAWAAVLVHPGGVLAGASALRAYGVRRGRPDDDGPIEVAVAASRRPADPEGVRTTRLGDFKRVASLNLSPPRVRIEHAVLTVAGRACFEDEVVAVIADAVQQRRTTVARLLAEARLRTRLRNRSLILEVLDDVAGGAYSALERRYLRDVEAAHRLPAGTRQRREVLGGSVVFRDVAYDDQAALVELDGRLGHAEATDRWADLGRDREAAVDGRIIVRLGWRQVLAPCRVARAVGAILIARGWTGLPTRCGEGCSLDSGVSPAPGAGETPLSAA